MKLPQVTAINGIRVLTTQQVSAMYGTNRQTISYNFNYNKSKFKEGKHYIVLSGKALRDFKGCHENLDNLKYSHIAYLWTEKGALLHAKSLNTDKAWKAYDYLVDFYFRAKEVKKEEKPIPSKTTEESFDIAPYFRKVVKELPIEALDAMERSFRTGNSKPIKIATLDILAEKMKRSII